MGGIEWHISPGALLVFALLYFFDEDGLYAALLPAVAVHEAGHWLFLRLGGLRLRRMSLGFFGMEMDYRGSLGGAMGALAIVAGPVFGLAYSALVFSENEYLRLSGGISLALSIFNLLPVLPLDGGRLVALATGERAEAISRGISLALAAIGAYLWLTQGWFSVFAMGAWLAWWNHRGIRRARRPRRAVRYSE